MIYIFTVSYGEAQPILKYFQLKKEDGDSRFQVFGNEAAGIRLTVMGKGTIAAAVAVSSICTKYRAGNKDFFIGIGTCTDGGITPGKTAGGKEEKAQEKKSKGMLYLCNQLIEPSSGRAFYPDVLYRHGFPEGCAEDMVLAAMYQAAGYFFGPHRMTFFAAARGTAGERAAAGGRTEEAATEPGKKLTTENLDDIAAYILRLREIMAAERQREAAGAEIPQIEKLCEDLHCSQVMRDSVLQHIRYFALADVDYKTVIEELYREGKLPCRDKREGKRCFEELKRRLL